MSQPHPSTHATVGEGAIVGIVGEEVHDVVVYQVLPGASPQQKYTVGVHYLADGIPNRARELIEDARSHGFNHGKVQFHWVLAMLAKRSYRDLTTDERHQLAEFPALCTALPHDAWTPAVTALCRLLECLATHDADPRPAITALAALDTEQRAQILRHLDLVLTGGLRDSFWAGTRRAAEATQMSNDRAKRVWAYFHPRPARPRVRRPAPSTVAGRDRVRAVLGSIACGLAVLYLGQTIVLDAQVLPILAYVIAVGAAVGVVRTGHEWRYRSARIAANDRLYRLRPGRGTTLDDGFARRVDHAFAHYAAGYAPRDDSQACLAAISGYQAALRNEIVENYRESLIPVGRIRWLIRYETSTLIRQWKRDELFSYRTRYRVEPTTKLRCVVAIIVLLAAAAYIIAHATTISVVPNTAAAVVAAAGAIAAGAGWSRIVSERRRVTEEQRDCDEVLASREDAYTRWKDKLDSTRPDETEMERWLSADKTLFVARAMKHYKLAWRDILTHAYLQTPAANCKRARGNHAPWRYSRYDLRLFLITRDGVRELSTELDFEKAAFCGEVRNNFRFDAVSSVHVTTSSDLNYRLELVLMNGGPQNIDITDHETSETATDESALSLAKMSLEAAGFTNTLHILEGIAAEGKNWIQRDPYINTVPTAGITDDDLRDDSADPPDAPPEQ
ncbi:hypothetical protein [Amycolatopsis sp. H20-H5]|uniref:hypothetical protein n=1 Tax=Amycolatopsis sp. H20-H5 TaxID=3046309 RepID=UPI002DB78885|nr:hypothetical protein [Amycolatopsis sp. H20-H5]MEC3978052.1 hypothetical protein [Amycolatopsis sp. H20-H5]